jgi:hypothetical protein
VIERKERWQETHDREKAEIGRKEKGEVTRDV